MNRTFGLTNAVLRSRAHHPLLLRRFASARSPYDVLGIRPGTSEEDIKKAYRKAALTTHPDRPGGSEEKFKEVSAAYEQLTNPDHNARNPFAGSGPSSSGPGHHQAYHGRPFQQSGFGDPFSRQEADRVFQEIFGKDFKIDEFFKTVNSGYQNNRAFQSMGSRSGMSQEEFDNIFAGMTNQMFNSGRYKSHGAASETRSFVETVVKHGRRVRVQKKQQFVDGRLVSTKTTEVDLGPADGSQQQQTAQSGPRVDQADSKQQRIQNSGLPPDTDPGAFARNIVAPLLGAFLRRAASQLVRNFVRTLKQGLLGFLFRRR